MAKGAITKTEITNKLLEIFPGSFIYDKEIRIPMIEEGEQIQIKVALTCAKNNVEPNGDVVIPGEEKNEINFKENSTSQEQVVVTPTQEEKDNVKRLMESLGL